VNCHELEKRKKPKTEMSSSSDKPRLLTNYEVYSFLKERKDEEHRPWGGEDFQNLLTVQFEVIIICAYAVNKSLITKINDQVLKHLSKSPCTVQNEESISKFMEEVAAYNLTKAETLMIINSRPASLVELYLVRSTQVI
jgi:hypothetical protein